MTWWNERILPRLVDAALPDRSVGRWRALVCGGAHGVVLEVGFGSGRSLPYYPPEVSRVLAVEPSDTAWERAKAQGRFAQLDVCRVGLDGAALALSDASVDSIVSTWTLCTIPDLRAALGEFTRVLRPGGAVHFVEHTSPAGTASAALGRVVQPAWGPLAGGCHLDRDIEAELERAAYEVSVSRSEGWFRAGVARPRAPG